MQKIYLPLFLLLLSGCITPVDSSIDVVDDKFKGETVICSKDQGEYNREYTAGYERSSTPRYFICHYKKADGSHMELISGTVQYNSPVPIEYNEAIDVSKQKLKIKSKDDRRLGMTINEFGIILPKDYIYKNDNIEIKIYGKIGDAVLTIPASTVLALREKIKESEGDKIKK